MTSIVGVWRLVSETARDAEGRAVPGRYGPMPLGTATFTAEGRMMAVLSDGRPGKLAGARLLLSYCGNYRFDGTRLVTDADAASPAHMTEIAQVREARFQDGTLILNPPASDGVVRELTWERLSP